MKRFKKLLLTLLLSPILPIFWVADDNSNNDDSGDAVDDNKNDSNGNGENDNNDNEKSNDKKVIFDSQDAFDKVISKRINQAIKNKQTEWENEKKKAEMTEVERLKTEKAEAETRANTALENANNILLKAEVISGCSSLNIIDADAALALIDRSGIEIDGSNVKGVKQALKDLIEGKPWLVKNDDNVKPSGDDQNSNPDKNKGTTNMNAILKRMAGY